MISKKNPHVLTWEPRETLAKNLFETIIIGSLVLKIYITRIFIYFQNHFGQLINGGESHFSVGGWSMRCNIVAKGGVLNKKTKLIY